MSMYMVQCESFMYGYVGIATQVTIGHIIVRTKKVNIQKYKCIKI